jgi:hypothetical protein
VSPELAQAAALSGPRATKSRGVVLVSMFFQVVERNRPAAGPFPQPLSGGVSCLCVQPYSMSMHGTRRVWSTAVYDAP